MALFKVDGDALGEISTTTLANEGMKERYDLQRLLRGNPDAIEPGLFILTEEFSYWEDSGRRIDLLGMDSLGRLVVIELKRDQSGGFMDLQALRYAAMIANVTAEKLVEALKTPDAEAFRAELGRRTVGDEAFIVNSAFPRIVLIAGDFSTELTTSVLWLNDASTNLAITCIRARLYRVDPSNLVLDIETVIPLPEERAYRVHLREQRTEELEKAKKSRRERSLQILIRGGVIKSGTAIVLDTRKAENGSKLEVSDPKYRARFGAIEGQRNVIWESDGQAYSLSALTEKLRDEYSVGLPGGSVNGYFFWRLESGPAETLADLARKAATPPEGDTSTLEE